MLTNNLKLTSLSGLGGLRLVANVEIEGNPRLRTLRGLEGVRRTSAYVVDNPVLADLEGLENLASVGTLWLEANPALETLEGLRGLRAVRSLWLIENDALTSLDGLEGITGVAETLSVGACVTDDGVIFTCRGNHALESVDGLRNLVGVGQTSVIGNLALTNLNGFANLISIGQNLEVVGNVMLPQCEVAELAAALGPNGIGGAVISDDNDSSVACEP